MFDLLNFNPAIFVLVFTFVALQVGLIERRIGMHAAIALILAIVVAAANVVASYYMGTEIPKALFPLRVFLPLLFISAIGSKLPSAKFIFVFCTVLLTSDLTMIVPTLMAWLGDFQDYQLLASSVLSGLLLILFIQRFVASGFREMLSELDAGWAACSFFEVFGTAIVIVSLLLSERVPDHFLIISNLAVFIMCAATVIVLLNFYQSVKEQLGKAHDVDLMRAQRDAQEKMEEASREKEAEEKRRRHDRRHGIQVIIDEINEGRIDEAVQHLKAIRGEDTILNMDYCRNKAVNSVIRLWVTRSEDDGIDVKVSADVPEELDIDSLELATMFGNLLENAYEGCMRLEKNEARRYIDFSCTYRNGKLIAKIENACRTDVAFKKGMPQTQKRGGGIGTQSVKATVESHGGRVEYTAEDGVFRTRLLMAV